MKCNKFSGQRYTEVVQMGAKRYFLALRINSSLLVQKVAKVAACLCQLRLRLKVTYTRLNEPLFSRTRSFT